MNTILCEVYTSQYTKMLGTEEKNNDTDFQNIFDSTY